jgi:DNA polymerase bacteriophage-type
MSIHLDFESRSRVDLISVGAYRYAEDDSTEALIAGFSIGKSEVVGVDLTRRKEHRKLEPLFNAIEAGEKIVSHNAGFERNIWEKVCRKRWNWPKVKSSQWVCTSARSRALSLPGGLDMVAKVLGLGETKDPIGGKLISKFCKPQRDGRFIQPSEDPQDFKKFIRYCKQDVVVEREIDRLVPQLTDFEQKLFALDYKINNAGIPVDVELIHKAIEFIKEYSHKLEKYATKKMGCRPSQRDKCLHWLREQGYEFPNLQAATVEAIIADPGTTGMVRRLLESRIELSKAGTKKLTTMLNCVSKDGRIRGAFWFLAASTGRWGSNGVQFHNLAKPDKNYPQNEVLEFLELDGLDLIYDRPLSALASSIRGFLKSPEGRAFLIADYNAIEARGLAWTANERWLLQLFLDGGDPYTRMASKIYKKPEDQIDKESIERFLGKQTILGGGYGMGAPKFQATCARFGQPVSDRDARKAIRGYRKEVPRIVDSWYETERAALRAVISGDKVPFCKGKLSFEVGELRNGFELLYINLPSGRRIAYPKPRIEHVKKWGKVRPTLVFKTWFRGSWRDEETYGGKEVENYIQALCRDVTGEGMVAVDREGFQIILHVHDEIGSEIDDDDPIEVPEYERMVCQVRPWAKGLPLKAGGKKLYRYEK